MALDDDALRRLIKGAMKRSRTAELLSLETVELANIDNLIRTELARRAEEALRYGGR